MAYFPISAASGIAIAGSGALSTTPLVPASVAAAGTTQGTATAVSAVYTIVTTVASGSGVILAGVTQGVQVVVNRGAATVLVYPPTGAQIEAGGSNVAYQIASGSNVTFLVISSTQIYALASSFQ